MTEVFAAYGRAVYYAQLLEYDLVSVWMLESITQGVSLTREDLRQFQGEWSKKTLGRLLHPLKQSALIPGDLKQFLEAIRTTRNALAHSFFIDVANDLLSLDGRERAKARLERMGAILEKGQGFFQGVLTTYARDFGIDLNAVRRQIIERKEEDAGPGH